MNEIVYAGQHSLTFSVSRHAHRTLELVYCTSGRGRFVFEDMTLPYEEGDVVVIPPFLLHSNIGEDGFTNIHINLSEPSQNFLTPMRIRDDGKLFIKNAFTAAYFHFSEPGGRKDQLLTAYGNLLLSYVSAYRERASLSSVVKDIKINIIRRYPDVHFELDVYLHALPFNYDYLRRLFKKEVGVTPHQYLMDMRLTAAANHLSLHYGGCNIAEVSYMCGFRESLYFSRMFKKKFGISPRNYLKIHAQNKDKSFLNSGNVKIMMDDSDV